jgi:hypothetical protein
MTFSSLPAKRLIQKNFFRFVRRYAMPELKVKGVALVPFKIGYPHAPPLSLVIHSMTKDFVKINGFLFADLNLRPISSPEKILWFLQPSIMV